jgi:hypothetical protein
VAPGYTVATVLAPVEAAAVSAKVGAVNLAPPTVPCTMEMPAAEAELAASTLATAAAISVGRSNFDWDMFNTLLRMRCLGGAATAANAEQAQA